MKHHRSTVLAALLVATAIPLFAGTTSAAAQGWRDRGTATERDRAWERERDRGFRNQGNSGG